VREGREKPKTCQTLFRSIPFPSPPSPLRKKRKQKNKSCPLQPLPHFDISPAWFRSLSSASLRSHFVCTTSRQSSLLLLISKCGIYVSQVWDENKKHREGSRTKIIPVIVPMQNSDWHSTFGLLIIINPTFLFVRCYSAVMNLRVLAPRS
jgi:hypothetical protein